VTLSRHGVEGTCLAADTVDMPRKSKRPPPSSWDIYQVAKKGILLGTVEAPHKATAIEKGARKFKTEAWRLYAMAQR
jgi:hypothetical protein